MNPAERQTADSTLFTDVRQLFMAHPCCCIGLHQRQTQTDQPLRCSPNGHTDLPARLVRPIKITWAASGHVCTVSSAQLQVDPLLFSGDPIT
jgi:hypothetical protein